MEITQQKNQNSYTLQIPPQNESGSSASILIVALSEQAVRDYLTHSILEEESYLPASDKNTAEISPYSYVFSTALSFFTADSAFPTTRKSAASLEEASLYLRDEITQMPRLRAIVTLGVAAHHLLLQAYRLPRSHLIYRPGHVRNLPDGLLLAHGEHIPPAMLKHEEELQQRLHFLRRALICLKERISLMA